MYEYPNDMEATQKDALLKISENTVPRQQSRTLKVKFLTKGKYTVLTQPKATDQLVGLCLFAPQCFRLPFDGKRFC